MHDMVAILDRIRSDVRAMNPLAAQAFLHSAAEAGDEQTLYSVASLSPLGALCLACVEIEPGNRIRFTAVKHAGPYRW